jgi:hypothetical protein
MSVKLPKGGRVVGATAVLVEGGVRGRARVRGRDGQRWRCHSCGEVLASCAACERHAREPESFGAHGCWFDCVVS